MPVNVQGRPVAGGDLLLQDGICATSLLAQDLKRALIAQDADDFAAAGWLDDRDGRFRLAQKIRMLGHSSS
jgi:hypothetical protein